MMDTVLNLGLNDVVGAAASPSRPTTSASRSTRTAGSCRCSARSCSTSRASASRTRSRSCARQRGVETDPELSRRRPARAWSRRSRSIVEGRGRASSSRRSPHEQLRYAIEAVFKSWNGGGPAIYRKLEKHRRRPRHRGQRADDGVRQQGRRLRHRRRVHARPRHGREPPLRRLPRNAQGEDVVAGIRITEPLDAMANDFPECHTQLLEVMDTLQTPLPRHVRHRVHDRAGPPLHPADARRASAPPRPRCAWPSRWRTRASSTSARRCCACSPRSSTSCSTRSSTRRRSTTSLAKGLNASPGAAVGKVYFTADDAEAHHADGRARDPRPARDLARRPARHDRGRGHPHVARRAGEPRGGRRPRHGHAGGLRRVRARHRRRGAGVPRGRHASCARATSSRSTARPARSWSARCRSSRPSRPVRSASILGWADEFRTLKVRTNADLPHDAQVAPPVRRRGHRPLPHRAHVPRRPAAARPALHPRRRRGARSTPRSPSSRSCSAPTSSGILEAMDGLPVTVRLLDPPLHEFLPDIEELLVRDAKGELDDDGPRPAPRGAQQWQEANPMLGTRGVRLGDPQARALPDAGQGAARSRDRAQARGRRPAGRDHDPARRLEARARARGRAGCARSPRRRSPTAQRDRRGRLLRRHDDRDAARRARRRRDRRRGRVLLVRHQRPHADDVRVLPRRHRGPVHADVPRAASCSPPTRSRPSTATASAQLVRTAVELGRERSGPTSSSGSAASTAATRRRCTFCHEVGLDYVSCSPYRVPLARLAAAHAALGCRRAGLDRLTRTWRWRAHGSVLASGVDDVAAGGLRRRSRRSAPAESVAVTPWSVWSVHD